VKGDDEIGWTYGVHGEKRNAGRKLVGTLGKKETCKTLRLKY